MLVQFRLHPVTDIVPAGSARPTLHWLGLSSGWYWLLTGGTELFRHRRGAGVGQDLLTDFCLPYHDGDVGRLWEKLLALLPVALDPVPAPFAQALADAEAWHGRCQRARGWFDRHEGDPAWAVYHQALGWWDARRLDTGYMRDGPRVWFWRVGERLHIRWDNRARARDGCPVWEAQTGDATLPVGRFCDEVRAFDTQLLTAMAGRILAARARWPRPDVVLDLAHLEREQRDRGGRLARSLDRAVVTPPDAWGRALQALGRIEEGLAP